MNETLLWLFVINLGVAFGAGLYEHRITVPRWITSLPESGAHWHADIVRSDDPGRRFWGMVTTVPLTLLTLANCVRRLADAWCRARLVDRRLSLRDCRPRPHVRLLHSRDGGLDEGL